MTKNTTSAATVAARIAKIEADIDTLETTHAATPDAQYMPKRELLVNRLFALREKLAETTTPAALPAAAATTTTDTTNPKETTVPTTAAPKTPKTPKGPKTPKTPKTNPAPVATPAASNGKAKVARTPGEVSGTVAAVAARIAEKGMPTKLSKQAVAALTLLAKATGGLSRAQLIEKTKIGHGWSNCLGRLDENLRNPASLLARKFVKAEKHDVDGSDEVLWTITAAGRKAVEKSAS